MIVSEECIEHDRNGKVWKTEVSGGGFPEAAFRLRSLIDERNTRRYIKALALSVASGMW